ncbi:hypothetical protein [Erythrobacter aureus]|uniref:hypothetical protein n=1 Tax=Erythrobacter aureus TaxID=2182384 RepID=UPI003A8DCE11
MSKKAVIFLLGTLLAGGAVIAQEGGPQEAITPEADTIGQEKRTDNFISDARRSIEAREALAARGGKDNVPGLQALIKAVGVTLPDPAFVEKSEQKEEIRELFIRDVALRLALLGHRPNELRSRQSDANALVQAAAASVRGNATLEQEMRLADTVVFARIVEADLSDVRDDGFRSTLSVEVLRASKGAQAGDIVQIRQASGRDGDRAHFIGYDLIAPAGTEILLVGSKAAYRDGRPGRAASADFVEPTIPMFIVEDGKLRGESPKFAGQALPF